MSRRFIDQRRASCRSERLLGSAVWLAGRFIGAMGPSSTWLNPTRYAADDKTASAFEFRTQDAASETLEDTAEVGITFWGDYA